MQAQELCTPEQMAKMEVEAGVPKSIKALSAGCIPCGIDLEIGRNVHSEVRKCLLDVS